MNFDIKLIFVVGFFCFGIQAICSLFLFFYNRVYMNFFSASYTLAGVVFSLVLTLFFHYSYRSLPKVSEGVVDSDTASLIDELKRGGGLV